MTRSDVNFFGQLIAILEEEDLIRLRRRFQLKGNYVMAEVMTDELEERELGERAKPV